MIMYPVFALSVFLVLSGVRYATCNPDAKRLYDDLLSNYNRLIRPVSNNTDTVLVKLGLRLSQLIELVREKMLIIYGVKLIGSKIGKLFYFMSKIKVRSEKDFMDLKKIIC